MQFAFWLFLLLLLLSPISLLAEGPFVLGALSGYAALLLCLIGISVRTGESDHLIKLMKPLTLLAAAIFLWMVFQTLPLPFAAIAHPVWANVSSALAGTLYGSVTIDTGATVVATIWFSVFIGLTFAASAVAIDRARAETLLVWLACLSLLFAVALLTVGLDAARSSFGLPRGTVSTLIDLSALGVILNAANIIRIIERYETRKVSQNIAPSYFATRLALSCGAFLVCCVATGLFATSQTAFVVGIGFIYFVMVLFIRRVGIRPWESAGLLAVVAIVLALVASINSATGDLTLRFAHIAAPTKAILANMISSTPWAGNGAGTFLSIVPIYQDAEGHLRGPGGATTAATVLIEFGRAATWIVFLIAIFLFAVLLKAAFERGRDSFYATAASSCVMIVLLESFCDENLLATPVIIVSAAILGLGFAQRASRTDQSRLSVA